MRREAAPSSARGGAVSTQLARLMRECQCRLHADDTAAFQRTQRPPPGIDAVLRAEAEATRDGGAARDTRAASSSSSRRTAQRGGTAARSSYAAVRERHVLLVEAHDAAKVRVVVPTPPEWVRDNHGQRWHLSTPRPEHTPKGLWMRRALALGSAGAIASVNFLVHRDVHPVVAKAIRDAPLGPMSDALRSATPVCSPTPQQHAVIRRLASAHQSLRHPNILVPMAFSQSVEGGVVLIWEFSPGGTMRQLLQRYATIKSITIGRFALQILSALSYLHERGSAHGAVSLDNVMVDANGRCRLTGQTTNQRLVQQTFVHSSTCYVSPAMAAGTPPTPACDVFCYGLTMLEAMTRQPCWRWATAEEYAGHAAPHAPPSAKALADLMAGGGRAFSNAVAQGRVVVNRELTSFPLLLEVHRDVVSKAVLTCFREDPATRPQAEELRQVTKRLLNGLGLVIEEDVG
ncbi:Protein tyrosine kinase/Protein kinase domain containing protein [Novymonas esmeraldas]|uniref:Protein tyrosine kinase/Protein kinase domain containing protein n=1 Tax=Novymonas esmeraldas TaxID=1808958 RepID=A0AAW0F016_9TRYP